MTISLILEIEDLVCKPNLKIYWKYNLPRREEEK